MSSSFLFFIFLHPLLSVIIDPSCTTNGKLDIRATNCPNTYPDAACFSLYGEAPTPGTDTDRSPACYTSPGQTIDHELKALSSEICPRQCGYCCQSPAFDCQNNPRPRIACDQVTQRMCRNPTWTELLAADCPNVCGFCNRGCIDTVPDCSVDKMICKRIGLENWVRTNCKRTCGLCNEPNVSNNTIPIGSCIFYPPDNNPKCASFEQNNFCASPFFDLSFKRQHCATTCKIC